MLATGNPVVKAVSVSNAAVSDSTVVNVGTVPSSGLVLWVKADSVAKGADNRVSTWYDLASLGNNATGPASAQPLYVSNALNGRPVLHFDGNDTLSLAAPIALTNFTIFGVYRNPEAAAPTGDWRFWMAGTNQGLLAGTTAAAYRGIGIWSPGNIANNGWLVADDISTTYGVVTFLNTAIYRNGVAENQYTQTSNITSLTLTRIGGHPHATLGPQNFIGDLAEILIYNTTLTPAVRSHVENCLLTKYAIGSSQPAGKPAADVQKAADDAAAKAAADAKKAADEAIAAQASATAASDAESLLAKIMDWIKSGKLDEADTQLKALEGKSGSLPASVQQTIKSTRDSLTAAQKAKSTLSLPAGVPGLPK